MKKRAKDEAPLLSHNLILNGQKLEDHMIKDVVGPYAITELNEIDSKLKTILHAIQLRPMKNQISLREKEVLHLIAYEHTMHEIARELYISHHTVVSHRKNLLTKLNAKNTAGMIRKAFEIGMLPYHQSILLNH